MTSKYKMVADARWFENVRIAARLESAYFYAGGENLQI